MDIHQLRVFISVFKRRSFSKAAEELHLSQPTVSDHIKSLEDELGCKLFDRLGRTIISTQEAETLYNYAIEIVERLNQAKQGIKEARNEPVGNLSIGASTIPGAYLLPEILKNFQTAYPGISFELIISDSKEIFERILSNELLLGVIGAKLRSPNITFTPIVEDNLILASPPSLIKKSIIDMEEIRNFPFILREEGSGTRKETERILASKGIKLEDLKIAGVFGSTEAVKAALKAGLGIAILSKLSIRDELRTGIIKEIKIKGLDMKRYLYIIVHKKRSLPSHYRLFYNYILSAISPQKISGNT